MADLCRSSVCEFIDWVYEESIGTVGDLRAPGKSTDARESSRSATPADETGAH